MAWIIIIIFFISIYLLFTRVEDPNISKIKEYKKTGLDFVKEYSNVDYYGGFKEVGHKQQNKIVLFSNSFEIQILEWGNEIIDFKNIKDCRILTNVQLSEKISMGKLLCFGVLAFGMKGKQKELTKDYVVVRCNYENEAIDLVLDLHSNNEEFVRKINRYMKLDNSLEEKLISE